MPVRSLAVAVAFVVVEQAQSMAPVVAASGNLLTLGKNLIVVPAASAGSPEVAAAAVVTVISPVSLSIATSLTNLDVFSDISFAANDGKCCTELRIENVRYILLRRTVILIDIRLVEVIAVSEVATVGIAGIDVSILANICRESQSQSVIPASGD